MQTDWRTDNWGGHRDVSRDPANYHYQRYQGEFYPYERHQYEADIDTGPNLIWLVVIAVFLLLILFNLPVLKECLTNINEHTTIMFDLLRNVQIYGN